MKKRPMQVALTRRHLSNLKKLSCESRLSVLDMLTRVHASHLGSALSVIDILVVLYSCFVDIEAIKNQNPLRDYVILSKGHSVAALYAVLAQVGIISESALDRFYRDGSLLGGHPIRNVLPGIEASTGSLGHGLSLGVGLALAAQFNKTKQCVYVVLGDGECQEGAVWEAIAMAVRFKLSNLTIIVDDNKLQSLCKTETIMANLDEKFKAFGCCVYTVDGHDHGRLIDACNKTLLADDPSVILAQTIKGKGISFCEDTIAWHYKSCDEEQYRTARHELEQE